MPLRGSVGALLALAAFLELHSAIAAETGPWTVAWKETLRAAEKEEALTLHLSPTANIEKFVDEFRKKFPRIRVTTGIDRAGRFALRVMSERRARKHIWDVCLCGPTAPYNVLYPANALAPVKPVLILPEVLDESKWWGGRQHYVDPEERFIFVYLGTVQSGSIYYNKNLVNPAEVHSYWDLLKPQWKGKILALDPRAPGPQRGGVRGLYHIPELGPSFLRHLFSEMDVTLSRDERQATDWLVIGKFPLCLFCEDAANAKKQGLPVDEMDTGGWKETPTLSPGGTGSAILLNGAPHPHAAKIFINWVLSREGQIAYQRVINSPAAVEESLRIDIPKDPIPPARRRKEGINYIPMHTPERANQAVIDKFLNEILKR